MRSTVRSSVMWACISLVAMIVITHAAGSNEATEMSVPRVAAEALECTSPAVELDGAAEAACGRCGDNFCNPRCGETAASCPRDCGGVPSTELMCGRCGDNFCNPSCGETVANCPRDCGVAS
jgi:hypothetical protein